MGEDGKPDGKVNVAHWWPGRVFFNCPIPPALIAEAERMGSRYLTVASYELGDGECLYGTAFCCPKDVPTRQMGREIALGRLKAAAKKLCVSLL